MEFANEPIQDIDSTISVFPQLTDRSSHRPNHMVSPSVPQLIQFSANGHQDNGVPATAAPQGDANAPVGYNMLWAGEQHYFIASPHPPHSTNPYIQPPNSALSRTQHAPTEACLLALSLSSSSSSSSSTNDSALSSSAAHHMRLPHTHPANYSPAQSANTPVSPLSPLSAVSYFSGGGFVPQDVWAGTELINPEPYDPHAFSSPQGDGLVATPVDATPVDATPVDATPVDATPVDAMTAVPRPKRSWFQMSKDGPGPPTLTTERQRTKLSRQMPPRQQHVGGSRSGEGNECHEPDALKEGSLRRTHNLIEKQYRNRLNAQFERLLATLPARPESQEERWRMGTDYVPDKTISKAEVLGMATQHIQILEQENRELLQRQDELIRTIESSGGNAGAFCVDAVLGPPPY